MKCYLFVLACLIYSSTSFANSVSINNDSSLNPIKKLTKKNCKNKMSNCFTLTNPYKMNTFCRLIQTGNYNAVRNLIRKGIDVNKKSIKLTPLMYAARHNRVAIVKLLIENGANLIAKSSYKGYTALKWAKLSNAKESLALIEAALKNKKG